MNYYIQGDAANADKINAAFEKLGYDTTGHLFNAKSVLYFTLDGGIRATTCNCTPAIIKTHPDYKELELPVEPKFKFKFKVGDWIVRGEGFVYEPSLITEIRDYYICELLNGERVTYTLNDVHKNFHLWSMADAKDGDVLVTTKIRNCPFIYRKTDYNNNLAYYYAGIDGNGDFCEGCLKRTLYHFGLVENVIPATKEQRDLLFKKMKEAGYQWDEEKKELRKIQPHYDISNFQPFDKVLVRDNNTNRWGNTYFGFYNEEHEVFVCDCCEWDQCIPFEGNEHLLGTTDMPSEEFINW